MTEVSLSAAAPAVEPDSTHAPDATTSSVDELRTNGALEMRVSTSVSEARGRRDPDNGSNIVGQQRKRTPRAQAISRALVARSIREGNTNSLRHGVRSEVAIRPEVLNTAAELYARGPWLSEVRDGIAVELAARNLVRLRRADLALDADPSDSMFERYRSLAHAVRGNLADLGLTPKAAADLGLTKINAVHKARDLAEEALKAYRKPVAAPEDAA